MKTMLAAYLPGNSTVDLREVAVPTPGINQVLIKMKSSGICGSDVHYIYHQHRATAAAPDKPLYQGFINGHEPCGQIVAMGQGCRHFKEGDRVLVYHISGCCFCPNCRRGFPISCTGEGKAAYVWQRDCGHAEYLLAEEKDLILLPDARATKMVRLSVAALARPMKGFCAAKFPAAITCWWSVWGRSA